MKRWYLDFSTNDNMDSIAIISVWSQISISLNNICTISHSEKAILFYNSKALNLMITKLFKQVLSLIINQVFFPLLILSNKGFLVLVKFYILE